MYYTACRWYISCEILTHLPEASECNVRMLMCQQDAQLFATYPTAYQHSIDDSITAASIHLASLANSTHVCSVSKKNDLPNIDGQKCILPEIQSICCWIADQNPWFSAVQPLGAAAPMHAGAAGAVRRSWFLGGVIKVNRPWKAFCSSEPQVFFFGFPRFFIGSLVFCSR